MRTRLIACFLALALIAALAPPVTTVSAETGLAFTDSVGQTDTFGLSAQEAIVLDYGQIPEEFTNYKSIELEPMMFSNMYFGESYWGYNSNTEMLYLPGGIWRIAVFWKSHLYINDYSSDYELLESRDLPLDVSYVERPNGNRIYDWGGICFGETYSVAFYGKKDPDTEAIQYHITKYDEEFNEVTTICLNDFRYDTPNFFTFSNVAMGLQDHILTIFTDCRYDRSYYPTVIKLDVQKMDHSESTDGILLAWDVIAMGRALYRNILGVHENETVYAMVDGSSYLESLCLQANGRRTYIQPDSALGDNEYSDNPFLTDARNMAVSSSHYLIATVYENYGINNIYLATQEKETGSVSGRFLTNATAFNSEINGNPWIVALEDDRFVLLWERIELGMVNVCSVLLDASGMPLGQVQIWRDCLLSTMVPICANGGAVWVSATNGNMKLYQLEALDESGTWEWDSGIATGDVIWDGTADLSWYQDSETVFSISTAEQLAGLAELVNAGNDFSGKTVRLEKDLFMNSTPFGRVEQNKWIPIGASENGNAVFNGTFDGQCHTIYNMLVPAEGLAGGVFGTIGTAGIVKCLTLEQGWFDSSACVADTNRGQVLYCITKSHVSSPDGERRGGVCRYNYGLIYGCQNYGFIEHGTDSGGIASRNFSGGTISQCANKGLIYTYLSSFYSAGIVSDNSGWLYHNYNLGAISDGNNSTAGIVGYTNGSAGCGQVYNCYSLSGYPLAASISYRRGEVAKVEHCYGNLRPDSAWYELFSQPEFLTDLNEPLGPCTPAWLPDTLGINNGLPITVAEYQYHTGNYKVQPELWGVSPNVTVILSEKDSISLSKVEVYFSDAPLQITSDNLDVAEIVDGTIRLKTVGSVNILFHLDETDESTAVDYTMAVTVRDHSFGDWYEISEAGCTTVGEERRDCIDCQKCEIREISALGHDFGAWTQTKAPTCETKGEEVRTCSRCPETETRAVAATGHDYQSVVTAPTCEDKGYTTYTCACGDTYVDDEVPATGHTWDGGKVTKEPTEDAEGEKTFTCACGATKTEVLPKLDHVHKYESVVTAPTCVDKGFTTYTCKCGDTYVADEVPALGHDFGAWNQTKAPTCETKGEETRTCSRCPESETREVAATGHDHKPVVTAPTCVDKGYTTYTCKCGDSYIADEVPTLGHDFGVWTQAKAPTCETKGEETRTCSRCPETETREVAATGHDHQSVVTAPTCADKGFTTYTCKCGDTYVADEVPALGHNFVTGDCTVCGAEDPDYVPENPFSDVKDSDYFLNPVLWAVDKGITAGTGNGQFSPDNPCTRGQVVTFLWRAAGQPEPESTENPFTDVSPADYFYKPVLWAVENGITAGLNATTFGPNTTCTRGQVVTFLWRAKGKPEAVNAKNDFVDVSESDYFYAPVLWAVENGITAGMGGGKFAPNNPCTRGQVVTFLYRAMK